MTPVKVHRYRAANDGEAKGSWHGARFVEGYHYVVKKHDSTHVVVSGVFWLSPTKQKPEGGLTEKNIFVEISVCKKSLVHDPIKS